LLGKSLGAEICLVPTNVLDVEHLMSFDENGINGVRYKCPDVVLYNEIVFCMYSLLPLFCIILIHGPSLSFP